MIKTLIVMLIISLPLIGYSENNNLAGTTYDWGELDKAEQDLIKTSSQEYLTKLVDNEVNEFWNLCHSRFKAVTPLVLFKPVGGNLADLIQDIDKIKFIEGKKIVYSSAPTSSQLSKKGSFDNESLTNLQFYTLAGIKNQVILIYQIEDKPLSKSITIKLGFENGKYKLTSIELNTNSVNGKGADYYYGMTNEWAGKESKFPQFIAASMAYRLSYLGRGTQTSLSLNIINSLKKLEKNKELYAEIKQWNIDNSIFEIVNVDFIETENDLTPNIIYVSKVKLGKEATRHEVEVLFEYFKAKYPGLVDEFGSFMFTAYEEYPVVSTHEYKCFRVLMNGHS